MIQLISLGSFIVLSILFTILMIVTGMIVSPKAKTYLKSSIYECGCKQNFLESKKVQYDIKFFLFALTFLIFDIETLMLYPFALSFNQLSTFVLVEAFIFVIILFIGLIYLYDKNILRLK